MWIRGVINTPGQQTWFHMKGMVVGKVLITKIVSLVSIVWSALGRTFHGLVSLAEIRPQDRNSVLVSFDRFF